MENVIAAQEMVYSVTARHADGIVVLYICEHPVLVGLRHWRWIWSLHRAVEPLMSLHRVATTRASRVAATHDSQVVVASE